MNMGKQLDISLLQHTSVSGFAFELLRNDVLFHLLGEDIGPLLYWEGKNLARKYPLSSLEDIIEFFERAGWGYLNFVKEKKNEMEFHLTGDLISYRNQEKTNTIYQLEAGFLAMQLEQMKKCVTETYEQVKMRSDKIIFTVQWDEKDQIMEA